MLQSYWIISLFWIAYFGLHSALATTKVKKFFLSRFGCIASTYRLLYSLFSFLGLFAFVCYLIGLEHHLIIQPTGFTALVGTITGLWGVLVLVLSFRAYSLREFIGLMSEEKTGLVITGIQSKVRHPLYLGTILLVLGLWCLMPSIENAISTILLIIYIQIGIVWEEKKLVNRFGSDYETYQKNVPKLLPKIRLL